MVGQTSSNQNSPGYEGNQPMVYQIRIQGQLRQQWSDWFEGLTIQLEENGTTLLTGVLVDQAALHGILRRIRDLGITLIAVNSVDSNPHDLTET